MKKIILLMALLFAASSVFAASPKPDYVVRAAINKYKAQNYTGCLQDLEKHVEKRPTALAYYYLGMSYTQAGKTEEATESYTKAIELAEREKNNFLKSYAMLGKKQLENPVTAGSDDDTDGIATVIKRKDVSPQALKDDLKTKHLEYLRNQINAGVTPNF